MAVFAWHVEALGSIPGTGIKKSCLFLPNLTNEMYKGLYFVIEAEQFIRVNVICFLYCSVVCLLFYTACGVLS